QRCIAATAPGARGRDLCTFGRGTSGGAAPSLQGSVGRGHGRKRGSSWMAVLTWLLVEGGCGTSQPKLVDAASQVESVRRGELEAAEVGAERGRTEEETGEERE